MNISLKDIIEEFLDYYYLDYYYLDNPDAKSLERFNIVPTGVGHELVTIGIFKEWCLWVMSFDIRNRLPEKLIKIKKTYLNKKEENFDTMAYMQHMQLILTELIDTFWIQFKYCYNKKESIEEFVKKHYDDVLQQKIEGCDSCLYEMEFTRDCLDAKKYITIQNSLHKIIESDNLVTAFNHPFYNKKNEYI